MEPSYGLPACRHGLSSGLVDSAVDQLAEFLRSTVAEAAKGGRPPERVRWTRLIGDVPLAQLIIGAILPLLPLQPKASRAAAAILSALEKRVPDEVRAMRAATRATLGWSLLAAVADSLLDLQGGSAVRLERRTCYRSRAGRTRRIDRYHLVAESAWLDSWKRDAGSRDWLIPPSITTSDAVRPESASRSCESTILAPYRSAADLLRHTRYRVNSEVLRVAARMSDGLSASGRESVRLAEILEERAFRFGVRMNFRGEILLGTGEFNPAGPDLSRALLLFAEPAPLGRDGRRQLAIHAVRMFTGRTEPTRDSLAWIRSHQEAIRAAASDPANDRWWRSAAQPWRFLAFCFEWARIGGSDTDVQARSGLPVHLPVSLSRALEGASRTMGLDRVFVDVEEISGRAHHKIIRLAARGHGWAGRWIDSSPPPGLRALLKAATVNAVMGYSRYGSTAALRGMIDCSACQGEAQLLAPIRSDLRLTPEKACAHLSSLARSIDTTLRRRDRERLLAELERLTSEGDEIARRWLKTSRVDTLTARAAGAGTAALMRHLEGAGIWKDAIQTFRGRVRTRWSPSPEAACAFLVRVADTVMEESADGESFAIGARAWGADLLSRGRSVEWTVPSTGFRVRQPYRRSEKRQTTVHLTSGQRIQPAYYEERPEPDVRRQMRRLPRDVIRSEQAAQIALALDRAARNGVRSAAADSSGCLVPPGDAAMVSAEAHSEPRESCSTGERPIAPAAA